MTVLRNQPGHRFYIANSRSSVAHSLKLFEKKQVEYLLIHPRNRNRCRVITRNTLLGRSRNRILADVPGEPSLHVQEEQQEDILVDGFHNTSLRYAVVFDRQQRVRNVLDREELFGLSPCNRARDIITHMQEERDVLLRELHHRVKNNLQMISSLLSLQLSHIREELPDTMLVAYRGRLNTIALVHRYVYETEDFSQVDFTRFVTAYLTTLSCSSHGHAIQIKSELHDIRLPIDYAVPCALILNELATNAIKYAFVEAGDGVLEIRLQREGNGFLLSVADNGIGMGESFQLDKEASLGLTLVRILAAQVNAAVECLTGKGARFVFRFRI